MSDNDVTSYQDIVAALAADGIICDFQNPEQLTVSRQVGSIWPNRGNTFWVTRATGTWHLFTWFQSGYAVPAHIDIIELCRTCMSFGSKAMHTVPDDIVQTFDLRELTNAEEEIVIAAITAKR
jgi:hypothetical protein